MTATNAEKITFETLIAGEQGRLVGLCRHITGDNDAAEDLVQETLLIAWRQRHKLTDPSGINHWLTAIARNVCRQYVRAKRQNGIHLPLSDNPSQTVSTATAGVATNFDLEMELERADLVDLLDKALGLLPADTHSLLIQHYIEGLPQAELGAHFGMTKGNVAVRLHRGKVALRQALVTDFRDDAVAYGLVTAGEVRWTETRIWCFVCGQHRLLGQFDHVNDELQLRCPGCNHTHDEHDRISYSQSARLRGVKAYKPAFSRVMQWVHERYIEANRTGMIPCETCGQPLPIQIGVPPGVIDSPPVVYVWCEHCNYCPGSNSWSALALSFPMVRKFWRAHPRMRALPERNLEIAGCPAILTGFESVTDNAKIEIAFAKKTFDVIELP